MNPDGRGFLQDIRFINKESKEIFCFRPASLIRELGLLNPQGWKYRDTAAYGHFGRDMFSWEKTDRADDLRKIIK
jgi:S-adenosylmethionine synthetase